MRLGRLKRRSDFVRVGCSVVSYRMSGVHVRWAPGLGVVRVGFTASKRRVHVRATKRNRAKRRLRACVGGFAPWIAQAYGDFVFIATRLTPTLPYLELVRQCREAVKGCIRKGQSFVS